MAKKFHTLVLDGKQLTIQTLTQFLSEKNSRISISPKAVANANKSHHFLKAMAKKTLIYGVNTGFGPMAGHVISKESLYVLQRNLVRSHATGVGEPIRKDFVLAAMIVRLNTLLKGNSGVSMSLLKTLEKMINQRVLPIIPEHGAVGTSGDLVQLAHIALVLMGEGECMWKGKRLSTKDAFRRTRIQPHRLEPKEGLALINGTSVMTAIVAVAHREARRLLEAGICHSAAALDIIGGYDDSLDKILHATRPHKGQIAVAEKIRRLLRDSRSLTSRAKITRSIHITSETQELPEMIQNVYSFRCVPQILGPLYDTLEYVGNTINIEMNSTTDNPIVAHKQRRFLHGGNFHGDYIATAIDQLKIPVIKLSLLAERRVNYFLDHSLNKRFPPFLNKNTPGLTLGLQGLQFVATSTAADNQTIAYPHSLHTISTNASNQDIVSMGADAALFFEKVVENTAIIQAIEAIALAQAYDLLPKQSRHLFARSTDVLHAQIRKFSSVVDEDRSLSKDVELIAKFYLHDEPHG